MAYRDPKTKQLYPSKEWMFKNISVLPEVKKAYPEYGKPVTAPAPTPTPVPKPTPTLTPTPTPTTVARPAWVKPGEQWRAGETETEHKARVERVVGVAPPKATTTEVTEEVTGDETATDTQDEIINWAKTQASVYGTPDFPFDNREQMIEQGVATYGEENRQFLVDTIYREIRTPDEPTYEPPEYPVYTGLPEEPETPSVTGNDVLDQMLKTFQDTLNTVLDQGQIVNPNIDITPDLVQKWADQASAELDPYYKSQFQAIKDDLSTDLTYLSDQYSQAIKSQESQFTQALATQREAEAGAGTIFSGERRTREEALGQVAERSLTGLGTSLAYQAGKLGTGTERTIGSLGLGGLTSPTWTPYEVSMKGEGRYTPLGGRQLFTPTGGITGTMEREKIEKKRAYSDLLKGYWLGEKNV